MNKTTQIFRIHLKFNAWQRSVKVCGLDAKANQVFLLKTDLRDKGNKIAPFYSDVRARDKNWPQSNNLGDFSRFKIRTKAKVQICFYVLFLGGEWLEQCHVLSIKIFDVIENMQQRAMLHNKQTHFYICLPLEFRPVSGDVPPHLAQPCYVAIGQALIRGIMVLEARI